MGFCFCFFVLYVKELNLCNLGLGFFSWPPEEIFLKSSEGGLPNRRIKMKVVNLAREKTLGLPSLLF